MYPSRYEGFGFRYWKRWTTGVLHLRGTSSSVPEVVGKAGFVRADPDDSDDLAEKMAAIADPSPFRDALILKGKERAGRFTWKECAEQTLAVYENHEFVDTVLRGGLRTMGTVKTAIGRPLVSVITVVYKWEANDQTHIKSLLMQTYPHIEYIDGGSVSVNGRKHRLFCKAMHKRLTTSCPSVTEVLRGHEQRHRALSRKPDRDHQSRRLVELTGLLCQGSR